MTLARDLTSAARVIEAGRKYQLEAAEAIRFALDILALGDASRAETTTETGDRELVRRASLPATRIDGAAGESPEQGPDASAVAADVGRHCSADMTAPRNPGKSVRDGEVGDALPEPDDGRTMTERVIDLLNEGVTDKRIIAQRIGASRAIVGTAITKARWRRDPRLKEFAPPAPVEEPEPAGESDAAQCITLVGDQIVSPAGAVNFAWHADPQWVRLVARLAHGGMMFLPDLTRRAAVKIDDARQLLTDRFSAELLARAGLRLAWQGKDMLRLEIIPQAKD